MVVPLPVEPLRRTPQPRRLPGDLRARRGEIQDQRPAPQPPLGDSHRAVEVLAAVQGVVQSPQHPVHQVARPMAAGVGLRLEEGRSLLTQRQDLLRHDPLVHVGLGPRPQAA